MRRKCHPETCDFAHFLIAREERVARLTMAKPSHLCVNCGSAPPPHRRKWDSCKLCAKRNLPATYYCGEACMEAHWPKHRAWHKAQKQNAKEALNRAKYRLEQGKDALDMPDMSSTPPAVLRIRNHASCSLRLVRISSSHLACPVSFVADCVIA